MIIETSILIFLVVFAYWFGCKRTQFKYDVILTLRGQKRYKRYLQNRTETQLFVAKLLIILLMVCIGFMKWLTYI